MSYVFFPGISDNPACEFVDANGEAFVGAYAEYELKLGVLSGGLGGRVRTQNIKFGVRESSQNMCDLSAGELAETLALASKGVIFTLDKKLGKYRNDEQPEIVDAGKTQYASLFLTNAIVDGSSAEDAPDVELNHSLYLPFVDLQGFTSLVADFKAKNIKFATSRYGNQQKSKMVIDNVENLKGYKLLDYQQAKAFGLVSLDETEGADDGVIVSN